MPAAVEIRITALGLGPGEWLPEGLRVVAVGTENMLVCLEPFRIYIFYTSQNMSPDITPGLQPLRAPAA